jgi:hypothetical protein
MADFALGNAPILNSVAISTNPTAGTVMADSGAVPYAGLYEVNVIIGQSAAATFTIQRRNAANGANVGSTVDLFGAAGQSGQYRLLYTLEITERVRVVMQANLTGTAAAAVQIEQRQ